MAGLDTDDEDRIAMLAPAGTDEEAVVRGLLDAVADAMPRSAPSANAVLAPRRERQPTFEQRLQARLARHQRHDPRDLPQLVTISLRVEADEEELVAGAVRLVPQAHDEQNPLHLADLALLWTGTPDEHGFGDRARTHATIALRAAADAWPVLDRLLELRVPDEIVLDTDELVSLLEDGVAALKGAGVDVLWPRSLGRDLTATTVLDRAPSAGRARSRWSRDCSAPTRCSPSTGRSRCTASRCRPRRWTRSPGPRPRCSGCAATGPSSTRRSRARPASGWCARSSRPRRSRPR